MIERGGNATVSFGLWDPNNPDLIPTIPGEVPLDRFRGDPAMGRGNNRKMSPKVVKINPGDSVSFIISGGHTLAIYDDGTKPRDISLDDIDLPFSSPPFFFFFFFFFSFLLLRQAGGILSDSDGRIYRGPDFTGRRDGVEVVQFSKPGTYLVICARKAHFEDDGMFGFVKVERDINKRW